MGHPRSLYFRSFSNNLSILFLQQMYVTKCTPSVRPWDLNPRPSKHESPPTTTSPGICICFKVRSTVDLNPFVERILYLLINKS